MATVPSRRRDVLSRRRGRRLGRGWDATIRRFREAQLTWLVALAGTSALIGLAVDSRVPGFGVSALPVPMVVASMVLVPRLLTWFVLWTLGVAAVVIAAGPGLADSDRVGAAVSTFLVGLVIVYFGRRRRTLGVAGALGESMLVDLRDRIVKQGGVPTLPSEWYAESVMRSAGGSPFAGDFLVAAVSEDHRQLQVVVVDVSGKGEQAGTRALLLSGAFSGLLGALPAGTFLSAANDYLMRQDWDEGFATAVHLTLDLITGRFELRSAGHPPAVQLHAGSGRWAVHEAEGPALGLLAGAEYLPLRGELHRGDTMLLYTDGLVETPQRDISLGIDKLLGQGEQLLRAGYEHGAHRLIDRLESRVDDRALMLLHRR